MLGMGDVFVPYNVEGEARVTDCRLVSLLLIFLPLSCGGASSPSIGCSFTSAAVLGFRPGVAQKVVGPPVGAVDEFLGRMSTLLGSQGYLARECPS